MADWTPQQLQQMNAVVMGSHDKLTPGGQIQPGYTLDQIYGGILPSQNAPRPAVASNRPTPAQLAAMQAIPAGSYRAPPNRPVMSPNTPAGSQFADTGHYGRATPAMQQLIQLATSGGIRPGWTIPQVPAAPAPAQNVQLPRPRPGYAPTSLDMAAINAPRQPVGANPGMGGAMLGNGVMSPAIPPQQPPADGSSPLPVWAGDTPQVPQMPQAGGYTAPGAPRQLTAAERYQLSNQLGQQAALERQAKATGTAGGYQYVNGQRVGYAPQTIGNNVYTPTNPATAYGLANAAGQIAALNRQAAAMSQGQQTAVQKLQAQGMSPSQAYAAANAAPGSVAAWDQRFAGGTQSGAPAVGGSYGGGGGGDGNSRGTPGIQYRR